MAMNSKVRFSVDDATSFRKTSEVVAAVANTAVTGSSLDLDVLSAYWEPSGELANEEEFAIFGQISEVISAGGTLTVQASSDDFSSDREVLVSKSFTATGPFTFVIAREQLAGKTKIRVISSVADSSSAIEFWAYASPLTK